MIIDSLSSPFSSAAETSRSSPSPHLYVPRKPGSGSEPDPARINTRQDTDSSGKPSRTQEMQEAQEISKLAARDREVRAHEAAHLAAGGQYTSRATFSYQRGPNGVLYAVGGEVRVNLSPVPGDPQATLRKAEIIRRAAQAPAQPSAQDRAIAQRANQMARQARAELSQEANSGDNVTIEEASDRNYPAGQEIKSVEETGDSTPRVDLFA